MSLEVRSRKLDYLKQYRWMLRDIASAVSEVVMERFAASEQAFLPDTSRDAATLYQRFAFLQSLLADELFDAAIHQVLARPYVAWVEIEEAVPPARGARASSSLGREIARPGPRLPAATSSALRSLPVSLTRHRTEATVDNVPNQFVAFALTRWRDVVGDVVKALAAGPASMPIERGIREATALAERIDALLSEELFRELSPLTHFPAGNQVLQKRAGYRDLFQAYVEFELAAQLAWSGGADVYGAGQRDVATLYEYWVFLQVAEILSGLCNAPFDFGSLLVTSADGLGIDLQRGRKKVLSGTACRLGRQLRVELWFNHTFDAGNGEAWTRPMRPDLSVHIAPELNEPARFEPTWVHFDAKYRVEHLRELFGGSTDAGEAEDEPELARGARRADLLKMHTYRDAIRRSAGAYVIYPGTQHEQFRTFHELLPGLGAFALQPTIAGQAEGASAITRFLEDMLTHVAWQASQHERGRYWSRQVYDRPSRSPEGRPAVPFLTRPPADTKVLIGYVKSREHLEWIHEKGLYNLRADARSGRVEIGGEELGAEIVVLYGEALLGRVELLRVLDQPRVMTRQELEALAYPGPRGSAYLCLSVGRIDLTLHPEWLSLHHVLAVRERIRPAAPTGAPVATTWLELQRTV